MTQEELNEILKQHKLWFDTKGEEGKRANLKGANLEYVNLTGADLRYAYLKGVDLTSAILRGVDLRDANLAFASLSGADLTGADLRGVKLIGANLRGANLRGANLTDTGIHPFIGPKHEAFYNSKDDKLFIGCQVYDLDYWLKNYINIGKEHEYTDKEIEEYGNWFKSLKVIS